MYDAYELLARIDVHRWPVLILCALAVVGNYIFFIEALRVARREKLVTIPIFCTLHAACLLGGLGLLYAGVRWPGVEQTARAGRSPHWAPTRVPANRS